MQQFVFLLMGCVFIPSKRLIDPYLTHHEEKRSYIILITYGAIDIPFSSFQHGQLIYRTPSFCRVFCSRRNENAPGQFEGESAARP